MPTSAGGSRSGPHDPEPLAATSPPPARRAADAVGRLQELLDELHARQAAERLADDTRAENGWTAEGGAQPAVQRVADDSASRSAPSTSSGTTESV
jgi:hypothetical protein